MASEDPTLATPTGEPQAVIPDAGNVIVPHTGPDQGQAQNGMPPADLGTTQSSDEQSYVQVPSGSSPTISETGYDAATAAASAPVGSPFAHGRDQPNTGYFPIGENLQRPYQGTGLGEARDSSGNPEGRESRARQ